MRKIFYILLALSGIVHQATADVTVYFGSQNINNAFICESASVGDAHINITPSGFNTNISFPVTFTLSINATITDLSGNVISLPHPHQ